MNSIPRFLSRPWRQAAATLIALGLVLSAGAVLGHTARAAGSAPSATSLTSSPNPSNAFSDVAFTATVTDQSDACLSQGSCVSPTGSVYFTALADQGSVQLGPTSPGSSQAIFHSYGSGGGTQTATASYQGDSQFAGSQGSDQQTVYSTQTTTTSLAQDRNASYPGQQLTLSVRVKPHVANISYPSGQVQFYEGGNPYGDPVSLSPDYNNNQGDYSSTAALATTPSGDQTFVARYLGDSGNDGSVSNQVTHSVVNPSVVVTLGASPNPSVAGQSPVWILISVQPNAPNEPAPTGTVTLYQDGNAVEQGTLRSGNGGFDDSFDIGLGDNYMTVNYYGDSMYPAASSGTLDQVVNQDSTTTTLSSSVNPSAIGQAVTFTSTTAVVSPGGFTPTGTVAFFENDNLLHSTSVDSSGHATFTTTTLPQGTNPIYAVYDGDTYCAYSSSNTVSQLVSNAPPPTVSAVSPRAGATAGGTSITITGTNFTAPATVRLGGTAATNVVVVSATQITATSPAHAAGTVNVQVFTGGGPSALSTADWYANGAPTVTGLSTHFGSSAGGTVLTVTGTGFVAGNTAGFGGVAGTGVTVLSPTQLRVTAPAGAAGTTVDVTVTNPAGTSGTSAADAYTYQAPPTVAAVSPRAGATTGGTSITITGTNFTAPATVRVGGTVATNVVVVSATQITATSPAHAAGTVDVRLSTGGGSSTQSSADYYAYGAPTVTGLSTHSGSSAGGTVLIVTGTGFVAGNTVSFGGVAGTSVTVLSPAQLRVTAPAGTAGTIVDVTVTNPAGTSGTSTADAYTYQTPPTVSAVSPRAGATTGGTSITITGTNFTAPATVRLGGTAATQVLVVSATQITATTPPHAAGTVNVQVFTGGGPSALSTADWYAYGAPTVTGLSTHSGSSAGGTVLNVNGTGFVAGDTVSFGGVAGTSVTVLSPGQLRVTAPAGTTGTTVDVTVTNPAGTSGTSAADAYSYT